MSSRVFIEPIETLTPGELVRHFIHRSGVVYPELPTPSAAQLANAAKVMDNRFELVGEEYALPAGFSWKLNLSRDKEWQIAHHKFYFAVDLAHAYRETADAAYLEKWVELLDSWLEQMGSGYITASDAQVEAKRIEHWISSFSLLQGTPWDRVVTGEFLRKFLARIASETDYIAHHLRPARNHRTFQLFSVFTVGVLFPELAQSGWFIELAKTKLTENLLSDFLADGVHVELSTHYHQLVVETALAFIDLAQSNGVALDPALLRRVARATEFSMFMQWPDGAIPLVNDSDNGDHLPMLRTAARIFGDPRFLWAGTLGGAGEPPREVARHFDESGYFVLSDFWGSDAKSYARRQHVLYDCAKLGEGSHSHYDLFSFCYFARGEPLIVDPGRYTYHAEPDAEGVDWRERFKSTAYHNTVTVDGADQTRYISKWKRRMAAKADPSSPLALDKSKHGPDVRIENKDFSLGPRSDWIYATARSFEYSPLHSRLFVYMRRQYLFIVDTVEMPDRQPHDCVLRFHLSERWLGETELDQRGDELVVRVPPLQIRCWRAPGIEARLEQGWVSRYYGVKMPAPVVALAQKAASTVTFCSVLAPQPEGPADIRIESLSRTAPDSAGVLAFEVRAVQEGRELSDTFVLALDGPRTLQLAGVTCHTAFCALRRDAAGRVQHLLARRPQHCEIEGSRVLPVLPSGHVEWTAA